MLQRLQCGSAPFGGKNTVAHLRAPPGDKPFDGADELRREQEWTLAAAMRDGAEGGGPGPLDDRASVPADDMRLPAEDVAARTAKMEDRVADSVDGAALAGLRRGL